ncbi:MAG TPA: tail fiber domain-containing protein [Ferruginibacter sp.]|nr:tail fiber domain-containing protein [Ferruginibacter sp.]
MKKLIAIILPLIIIKSYAQNVGIGLTSPDRAKLEINGVAGAGNTVALFGGDGHGISIQRNWATIGFNQYRDAATGFGKYIHNGFAATQSLDPSTGTWALDVLPYGTINTTVPYVTRALAINSVGYIGVGNAIPNAPLQFPNTLANRKIVMWENTNNDHQYYGFGINGATLRYQVDAPGAAHRFYSGTGTSSSNLLMTIQGDKKVLVSNSGGGGFLGINLDDAPYTLSIKQAGGTGIYLQEAASGTNWEFRARTLTNSFLSLRYNGSVVGEFFSNGTYTALSDSRLKTNIQDLPAVLNKIKQLRPVQYEMKNNNSEHQLSIGFLAQEVKELFPALVSVSKDTANGYKGIADLHMMDYSAFGVLAIKALQEQQQQIDEKQKQIDELKLRLEKLEKLQIIK